MSIAEETPSDAAFLVGVDGGGSKTEAALGRCTAGGAIEVVARGTAGPANLRSMSAAAAWNECRHAIAEAFAAAGLASQPVAGIALAMAGAGSEPHREAFAQQVTGSGIAPRVVVTHDARPLIAGGTRGDCGIALIAGTGSLAYCRSHQGEELRCGGWGPLIGDEGSGYALAIGALRSAVAAWDGRGEATELLPRLRDWLGEAEIAQWPTRLQTWDRRQIAQGARIVSEAAAEGDTVASRLLDQTAAELANHLLTLWRRAFLEQPTELVFAGGLLVASERLRHRVLQRFGAGGGIIGATQVAEHPADLALQLLVS
jgi:N-acetylmuramic acid 6-phosphate etherase